MDLSDLIYGSLQSEEREPVVLTEMQERAYRTIETLASMEPTLASFFRMTADNLRETLAEHGDAEIVEFARKLVPLVKSLAAEGEPTA